MCLCLSLAAALVRAQTGVGQIQGTVSDATGAVVPGATVALENVQTDNRFQTTTSEAGFFVFPSLVPGDYRLTVSHPGMQKWEGKATLVAGQHAVINATLSLAQATEQVTVAGDVTPLLSTTAPTLATIVERARIEQLPLNGRSIQTLLSVAVPGLEGSTSQPKIYGLRDSAMDLLQDGVTLQDRNTGAIQSRPPGLDTIEQFRVETAVSSAKLTRPSSAIMITKSGTNDLHGAIFLTGRNSGFGVARQRQDTFTKAPHLVRNEFGACFAGYMYYNGYLPATVVADSSGKCAASATACVFGVPSGYVAVQSPINPAVIGGDANFNNTNNVVVKLANGTNQTVAYDNGLNPLRNQWAEGPWLTNLSASLYKTVELTEKVKLRLNLDAFNVLNQPGLNTPSTEGIISLRTSAQGARVLQYTARITW
jgi:hypothetical protein